MELGKALIEVLFVLVFFEIADLKEQSFFRCRTLNEYQVEIPSEEKNHV